MPPVCRSGSAGAPPGPAPEQPPGPIESLLLTAEQSRAVSENRLSQLRELSARGEDLAGALALALRNGGSREGVLALLAGELQTRITPEALQWAVSIRDPRKMVWTKHLAWRAPATSEHLIILARGATCAQLLPVMLYRYRGKVPLEVARSFARTAEATARNDKILRRILLRTHTLAESVDLVPALARWSATTLRLALARGALVSATGVQALLEAGNAGGLLMLSDRVGGPRKLPGGTPDLHFALLRAAGSTLPEITRACLSCGALVCRSTLVTLGQRWLSELDAPRLFPGGEVVQELMSHLPSPQHAAAIETLIGVLEGAELETRRLAAVGPIVSWLQRRLTVARANLKGPEGGLYSPTRHDHTLQVSPSESAPRG